MRNVEHLSLSACIGLTVISNKCLATSHKDKAEQV